MEFKEFRRKYQGKCAILLSGDVKIYLYIKKVYDPQIKVNSDFKCIACSFFCIPNTKPRLIESDIWYLNDRLFNNGTINIIRKSIYKDILRHNLGEEPVKAIFNQN